MSYSISDLLIRNLRDVFGENDPARRRAALDELWAEDGVRRPAYLTSDRGFSLNALGLAILTQLRPAALAR
jgi:hypothetical protein